MSETELSACHDTIIIVKYKLNRGFYMHEMAGLLVILNKLDKGEVTIKQLAEDLEVSTRTIQRYINEIELAQFPIVLLKLGTYSFQE
ncbi:MAG: HTH domain-containing protein [Endomicrobiia bacterium]